MRRSAALRSSLSRFEIEPLDTKVGRFFCYSRFKIISVAYTLAHHWRVGGSAKSRPANDDEINLFDV